MIYFLIKECHFRNKILDTKVKINLLQIKMSCSLSVADSVNRL